MFTWNIKKQFDSELITITVAPNDSVETIIQRFIGYLTQCLHVDMWPVDGNYKSPMPFSVLQGQAIMYVAKVVDRNMVPIRKFDGDLTTMEDFLPEHLKVLEDFFSNQEVTGNLYVPPATVRPYTCPINMVGDPVPTDTEPYTCVVQVENRLTRDQNPCVDITADYLAAEWRMAASRCGSRQLVGVTDEMVLVDETIPVPYTESIETAGPRLKTQLLSDDETVAHKAARELSVITSHVASVYMSLRYSIKSSSIQGQCIAYQILNDNLHLSCLSTRCEKVIDNVSDALHAHIDDGWDVVEDVPYTPEQTGGNALLAEDEIDEADPLPSETMIEEIWSQAVRNMNNNRNRMPRFNVEVGPQNRVIVDTSKIIEPLPVNEDGSVTVEIMCTNKEDNDD